MEKIKVLILPGGKLPEQGRVGEDIGYDSFVRAIVSDNIDPVNNSRETLWDFKSDPNPSIEIFTTEYESDPAYMLYPGDSVRVGLGVIFGMPNNWFTLLAPRSSSAKKSLQVNPENYINLYNMVPYDPGFRGEAASLIINSSHDPIRITKHLRLSQFIFLPEFKDHSGFSFARPELEEVNTLEELGHGSRGIEWNGSSGENGSPHPNQLILL